MCTEEWGPGSLLFSWLEEYSTLLYWNIPSRTGTCVRAYGVLGTEYFPSTGGPGGRAYAYVRRTVY